MPRINRGPRKTGHQGCQLPDRTGWQVRLRLWIDVHGHNALGPGKIGLLEGIADRGSLSAAAKQMNMSYRLAWEHLRLIEKRTGLRVVERQRGGPRGGQTILTSDGRLLLAAYGCCREEVEAAAVRACARHFAKWMNAPSAPIHERANERSATQDGLAPA